MLTVWCGSRDILYGSESLVFIFERWSMVFFLEMFRPLLGGSFFLQSSDEAMVFGGFRWSYNDVGMLHLTFRLLETLPLCKKPKK